MPIFCDIELNHHEALFLSQIWDEMEAVRSSRKPYRGICLHDLALRFNYGRAEALGLFWALYWKRLVGFNYSIGLSIPFDWKDHTLNLHDKGLEIAQSGSLPNPTLKIAVPPQIKSEVPRRGHSVQYSYRPGTQR